MLSSITRVVTHPDLDAAAKTVEFVLAYTKNSDHFMNSVLFKVCLHTIINSIYRKPFPQSVTAFILPTLFITVKLLATNLYKYNNIYYNMIMFAPKLFVP